MSDISAVSAPATSAREKIIYAMGVIFVLAGAINSMPAIPGWDEMLHRLIGDDQFPVRRFPTEYFYPLVFFWMMLIVALRHSMWVDWKDASPARRRFGLFMDLALVVAAGAISVSYLIEISSVCLIDELSGERAAMIAAALKDQIAFAKEYGLPIPDTVDDPKCVATTGVWLVLIVGVSMLVFLGYNIKVWGLPLVAISLLIALYPTFSK